MEKFRDKWFIVAIVLVFAIAIDCTEITTVYKFNTIRTGKESVKYLNTCTVAVYLEDNHQGLPLFNSADGRPLSLNIPLFYSSKTEQWQMEMENGSLLPIPSFDEQIMDLPTSVPWFRAHSITKERWETSNDGFIFNRQEINFKEKLMLKVTFGNPFSQFLVRFYNRGTLIRSVGFNGHYFEVQNSNTVPYSAPCSNAVENEVIFYISMYGGNFTIFDETNSKVHKTGVRVPEEFALYTVQHYYVGSSSGQKVRYEIVQSEQPNYNTNSSFISPWFNFKQNTSLFISIYDFYGSKSALNGTNNNDELFIRVFLEEKSTENTIQLECEDVDPHYIDKKTVLGDNVGLTFKRVLQKVAVRQPQNWTGQKRIRITPGKTSIIYDVWEGREEEHIKIATKQTCVESEFKNIYTQPAQTYARERGPLICDNGGQLSSKRCICPTGFMGNHCEIPCNRNRFGHTCLLPCSKSDNGCKGMVFCTESYGCSCAPGYHGDKCSEACQEGFYGVDCKETCRGCVNDKCDIYTGNCLGKCKLSYLIGPKCNQFYSYLNEAPTFLESNFTSMTLKINLSRENIIRPCSSINSNPTFFVIQYQEDLNSTWNNGFLQDYDASIESVSINGLNPGRIYYFKVLVLENLIAEDIKRMTEVAKGYTKCVSSIGRSLQATNVNDTSITVTWEVTEAQEHECPFLSYTLSVEELDGLNALRIDDIKETTYVIENLTPAQRYYIVLRKSTVYGDGDPIASTNVTTLAGFDVDPVTTNQDTSSFFVPPSE